MSSDKFNPPKSIKMKDLEIIKLKAKKEDFSVKDIYN